MADPLNGVLIPPPRWDEEGEAAPSNESIAALLAERTAPTLPEPELAYPTYETSRVPEPRAPTGEDITAMLTEALRRLGIVVTPAATEAPQVAVIDGLAIRDTSAHTPETDPSKVLILDLNVYEGVTLHIVNNLDQAVAITPYGNASQIVSGAVAFDSGAISVNAGASDALTILPEASGWLPYVYLSAICAVQPTAGTLTVRAVKFRKMAV